MSCLELEFQPELDVSWGADGTVVQGLIRVEVGFVLRIRVLTTKDGWDTASAKFPGNVTRVRAEVLRHPTRCANDSAELPPPKTALAKPP
jgi:hypothetical protein